MNLNSLQTRISKLEVSAMVSRTVLNPYDGASLDLAEMSRAEMFHNEQTELGHTLFPYHAREFYWEADKLAELERLRQSEDWLAVNAMATASEL